jgi:hypothetical protein
MTTLAQYKINENKKLDDQYKIDSKKLLDIYKESMYRINTNSYTSQMIYIYANEILKVYANNLKALQNKLRADKARINSLTSIPSNSTSAPSPAPTPAPAPVPVPTPAPTPTPIALPANKKRALLIGLNYRNTEYSLFGCINDAYSIERKLRSAYGFTNVSVLTDDSVIKPTAKNIYYQIQAFLQSGVSGDLLFLSYSGHGSNVKDNNGDELDGRDEILVGLDIVGIRDDDLKGLINAYLKPGVTLIMLCDSCFSGTILDLKYQYSDTQNNMAVNINNAVNETVGNVILISGSQDNQTSVDAYINNTYQGATSWAFVSSLNSNAKPTWENLINNMRGLIRNLRFSQVTQICSGKPLDVKTQMLL